MPYLIKHPSGVFYAQRKVPEHLQKAVPLVSKNGKARQVFLKRSLGTKDKKQADVSIKPVLMDFDRILREAEALEKSKPPARPTLTAAEINRMAEYVYAMTLQDDERVWTSVWERVSKAIRVSTTANDYKKGAGQRVTLDFVTVELADGGVLRL